MSGAGLRSTDGGKTWEKVAPFPKIGANGWRYEMVALDNGWLVASEVLGPGIGGERWRFVVSRDDGKSWDIDGAVVYYDPGRAIGGRACPRRCNWTRTRSAPCSTIPTRTNPAAPACFSSMCRSANLGLPKP